MIGTFDHMISVGEPRLVAQILLRLDPQKYEKVRGQNRNRGKQTLCMTDPSIRTRDPALHGSILHFSAPSCSQLIADFSPVEMNSVLPLEFRTKRFEILFLLWLAGRKERQPFDWVQSSKANQKPNADGLSV